jgi:hypothetical protein
MKDLYRKLGLDPGAAREAIESALENHPELAGDHGPVLLDPEKREVYDEALAALRAIGELRHRLGLDTGDTWFTKHYADFVPRLIPKKVSPTAPKPEAPAPVAEESDPPEPQQTPARKRKRRFNTPAVVAVILVAAVLVVLAIAYL